MKTHGPEVLMRRLRLSRLFTLVALGSAIAATLVGGARPAAEEPQLIAFTRSDGIYAMRADGSHIRALRRGPVARQAWGLEWSPDGRRLAFATHDGIWVMSADGTKLARVGSALRSPGSPTWSPDGSAIAYSVSTGSETWERELWLVSAAGTNARELASVPNLGAWDLDWSRRNEIVFSDLVSIGAFRLYVMGADGSNLRPLRVGSVEAWMPEWSPNGRTIAFRRTREADDTIKQVEYSEIYRVGANGRALRRVTARHRHDRSPHWSPDGRKIVFVRGGKRPIVNMATPRRDSSEIWVVNADGTGLERLTQNRLGEESPAWQPR